MAPDPTSDKESSGVGHNEDRQRSRFIGAIDQGTTSTRFLIFDDKGTCVASHQTEFKQMYPHPGWVNKKNEAFRAVTANSIDELVGGWNKTLVRLWGLWRYASKRL